MVKLFRKTQEGCGGLGGENPAAFPKAGPIFQQPFLRDAETTILIKFEFWRGVGRGKFTENCPKTLFFLGNSMTIKFGNSTNLIVRNFVVIWEAPNFRCLKVPKPWQG